MRRLWRQSAQEGRRDLGESGRQVVGLSLAEVPGPPRC